MDHSPSSAVTPNASLAGASPEAPDVAQVEEVLRALSTALRSQRLYGSGSPMLSRFVDAFSERVAQLWHTVPQLRLDVDERTFRCGEAPVSVGGAEGGELPFLFYKDGIRSLTLLPGFEAEVGPFLEVLARAPQLREEEDDLITLLWQLDLSGFRYDFVEAGAEGVELARGSGAPPAPIDAGAVRAAAATPPPAAPPRLSPDDFQETLYFLDDAELRRLADEVRREAQRDLWADVLSALLDRLEDGTPERQTRILSLLGELLASALSSGALERAAGLLAQLGDVASRPGGLSMEGLRAARSLFAQLADPGTLQQLIQTLEDSPEALQSEHLGALLSYFPPESLAPLLRAAETVTRPDVRRVLDGAIARVAGDSRASVVALLSEQDPALVAAGARWAGRLEIGSAVGDLTRLLAHPDAAVRLVSVEALVALRASTAGRSLMARLEDPDREVRIAAARALSALDYMAARPALEATLGSKRLRAADRSEKIAFYEAFGRLAGAEGVAFLDRTLNSRGWIGRGEPPEIRACAALALGRVRHPSARTALSAAANDTDPVVRSAVARAMRGEEA